ncbi:MAG: metallophosphoesterase family protein [Candidatus Heimdallarchaeota archaeon]
MIRLAVLSDIHGNLEALETIIRHFKGKKIDLWVCPGDIVGYGPFPNECIQLVKDSFKHVIMGNHDHASIDRGVDRNIPAFNPYAHKALLWTANKLTKESKRFLAELPLTETIPIEKITLAMFHGSPFHPLDEYVDPSYPSTRLDYYIQSTGADILILGHTHVPMVYNSKKEGMLLNPGSVGQPRDRNPQASAAIIKVEEYKVDIEIFRVKYAIDKTAKAMKYAKLPNVLWKRLFIGR